MRRIALTGGIATGKSYVLDRLRSHGVPCIDADELAHGVTAPGTEATAALAERFGADILDASGAVDRTKLGPLVFADAESRRALEAIVHPGVYRALEVGLRAIDLTEHPRFAVAAVPLLDESGGRGLFEIVVATVCAEDTQVKRLVARGMTEAAARLRIAAQLPAAEKAARADVVITTDGSFADTDAQVDRFLASL